MAKVRYIVIIAGYMNRTNERTLSYGFVIVAACFCLQAVGLGLYIGYGVFINPLISEFGWPRAALSGASSIALLLSGLLSVPVGRISDRIGPRLIVLVCAFFFGIGHLLMSRINEVWQLYLLFGVIVGIGLSCVDVIALSTTAQWFSKRRGSITGVVKVGAGFGHLLIPIGASVLITSQGWRTTYTVIGIASFSAFFIIGLLLRRAPAQASTPGNADTTSHSLSFKEAVQTSTFWIICFTNLVGIFCLMTVMVHIAPHASSMIDSPTKAAAVISVIGFTSMGGRLLTGFVIDRIGSKLTTIFCYILLAIVLLWLQIADAPWMLFLFAVFYGVAHGGIFTIVSPIVADYFGIKSHGVLFGIVVLFGTVGGSIGPFLSGFIFDSTGSYDLAFWICTAMSLIGLIMIMTLKPRAHKPSN